MNFGSIIKYTRVKLGIPQRELCEGICSIPHLSKIENNNKEANEETIQLLLDRLGVSITEVQDKSRWIQDKLNELQRHINFCQKVKIENTFRELEANEEWVLFSDLLNEYELIKFRYYTFCNKIEEASKQEKILNKNKKNFTQYENYLFNYYSAIFLMIRGKYRQANDLLITLVNQNFNVNLKISEIYYHLALVKSLMQQSEYAISFGKKALELFKDEFNFIRSLHTLMLLGISYTNLKLYEEALDCYTHLIRNSEIINDHSTLPHAYHNIGYLYRIKGDYSEALNYFYKSKGLHDKDSQYYLISLYAIAYTAFLQEDTTLSKDTFKELYQLSKVSGIKKYILLSNYYLLLIDKDSAAIPYLENEVMPFLLETGERKDDLVNFSKTLTDYYDQKGNYKKALYYSKLL